MDILSLLVGSLLGLLGSSLYFLTRKNPSSSMSGDDDAFREEVASLRKQLTDQQVLNGSNKGKLDAIRENLHALQDERSQLEAHNNKLLAAHSSLQQENKGLNEKLRESQAEWDERDRRFQEQFENLSNSLLEQQSKKFNEQSSAKVSELVNPVHEKMQEFMQRIQTYNTDQAKRQGELEQQLKNLQDLNNSLTQEAQNLTSALKGDSQVQGSWGEVMLNRILELAGFEEGRDFHTQDSTTNERGDRIRPDVTIPIAEGKFIIIDSKVSLTAYERWSNHEEETDRDNALIEHIRSIRSHIDEIHQKDYANIPDRDGAEHVLMFVPIETALTIALREDPKLYDYAYRKGVILVAPPMLLATLKVVEYHRRQEKQYKNAQEIARQAGGLYDKFMLVLESFSEVGKSLSSARNKYDEAINRLKTGKGNVMSRIERLKKLGISSKNSAPTELADFEREATEIENPALNERDLFSQK